MYTIAKQFNFSASHQLSLLPESHPCSRVHGHNYVVEIQLHDELLDRNAMVIDFRSLGSFKQYVDELDHQHLNDVLAVDQPTVESLAKYFYDIAVDLYGLSTVVAVRVSETTGTWAEYRP